MKITDKEFQVRAQALSMACAAARDAKADADPMEYVEDFYEFLSGKRNGPDVEPPELNEFNEDDENVIDFKRARKDYDLSD